MQLPVSFTPSGLAIDARGRLYLGDRFSRSIYRWDSSGVLIDTIGGPGEGPGEFSGGPQSLTVYRDSLLAAIDYQTGRLLIFQLNPAPRFLRTLTFPSALLQVTWLSARHLLVSAVPMPGESGVFSITLAGEAVRRQPVGLPPAANPIYGMHKVAARNGRAVVANPFTNRMTVLDAQGQPLWQLVFADLPAQAPGKATTEDPLYGTITLPDVALIASVALQDSSLYVLAGWPPSLARRQVWHLRLNGQVIERLELPVMAKGIAIYNNQLYALSADALRLYLYAL
ncbi:MAG: hypothetical protein Q9M35_11060 [Rhodothermus sp.]|nr:hypothetical protein [Rhodothermus sp.]